MRKPAEKRVSDLLGGALQRAGIMRQVGAAIVVQAADSALEEIFSEGILEYAQCRSYVDGEVIIACKHAAVAQEIILRKEDLVACITSRIPQADITDLSVVHRSTANRQAAWYDAE